MSLQSATILKHMGESGIPDAMLEGLRKLVAQIDEIMVRFRTEATRLKASNEYNAIGIKNRTEKAAAQAADKLSAVESGAHGYSDHIQQLEGQIQPATRKGDPILLYMQEAEVRARLADLDELKLRVKYQVACAEGGPGADLIAAAVENDPLPRLPAEVLQEGMITRGQRTSPDAAKKLQQIIRVRDGLISAVREAMAELHDAGLPENDPVSVLARGD